MLAIADFANDQGEAWPSVSKLAEKSRLSERGVQYILSKLKSSRHLSIEVGGSGPKDSSLYRVRVKDLHPNLTKGENCDTLRVQSEAVKGANGDKKGCKSFAPDPSVPVQEIRHKDPPLDLSVEFPPGFPKSDKEAQASACTIGCPADFVSATWNHAAGRGGRDSKDVPIRSWRHHLQAAWQFQRGRDGAGKTPEKNQLQERIEVKSL